MKHISKEQASKLARYWYLRMSKFQKDHPALSKRRNLKKEFSDMTLGLILGFSIEVGTYDATYYWSSFESNKSYNKVTVEKGVSNPYILIFIGEPYGDYSKSFLFDDKDEAINWILIRMYHWYRKKNQLSVYLMLNH